MWDYSCVKVKSNYVLYVEVATMKKLRLLVAHDFYFLEENSLSIVSGHSPPHRLFRAAAKSPGATLFDTAFVTLARTIRPGEAQ
mmetsp:Transcript_1800/g.3231  ORF Transcript_1800/g.3231 Transcript_1800/m.3231 type:complete len:84 (+) Transcript_1800:719-970(+)